MTRAATRRAERVLRALEKTGRRLVERGDGWVVVAGTDRRRRPFATLSDGEARDLIAARCVRLSDGGGYVLADAGEVAEVVPVDLIAAPSRTRSFAKLALEAERGEGPLSARGAAAGLRLAKDAELAARRRGLSMDWELTPTDRRPRGPADGGLASSAREAAVRLEKLRRAIGEAAFRLVSAACVEGWALSVVAQRCGVPRNQCGERLCDALEDLADAYDRVA